MNTLHTRLSGVLVHPTSFPSPYGIGDLGQGAYDFIDFLKASGQSLWQVLPLGPTGFGDSPYQSFSAFAGQSLLISPDDLVDLELITKDDLYPIPEFDAAKVDYGAVQTFVPVHPDQLSDLRNPLFQPDFLFPLGSLFPVLSPDFQCH